MQPDHCLQRVEDVPFYLNKLCGETKWDAITHESLISKDKTAGRVVARKSQHSTLNENQLTGN